MRIFLHLWVFVLAAAAGAEEIDLPKLRAGAEPHVFVVETFDAAGKAQYNGTGFFLRGPRGVVAVTNAHVVAEAVKAVCTLSDGSKLESDGVWGISEDIDIAVLALPALPDAALPIEKGIPVVGESVAVLGNPLGFGDTLSSGIVSALRSDSDGNLGYVQITAPISRGSSGSPVLNKNSRVIGMAAFTHKGGQSLNFAISARALWEFLSAKPVYRTFASLRTAGEKQAKAKIDEGMKAMRRKDLGTAIKVFQNLLREDPHNVEAAVCLCNAYAEAELPEKARALAEDLVVEAPDNPAVWLTLANLDYYAGDYRASLKHLHTAVRLAPDYAAAWDKLAIIYGVLGRTADQASAREKAAKARKASPGEMAEISVPFNCQWKTPRKDILASFERIGASYVSLIDSDGVEYVSAVGVPQKFLDKTVFCFGKEGLSAVELKYGESGWNRERWLEFFDMTLSNVEGKYGPGQVLCDRAPEDGDGRTLVTKVWRQDEVTLVVSCSYSPKFSELKMAYLDSKDPIAEKRIKELSGPVSPQKNK